MTIRPDIHARFEAIRRREHLREEYAQGYVFTVLPPRDPDGGSWDNAVRINEDLLK